MENILTLILYLALSLSLSLLAEYYIFPFLDGRQKLRNQIQPYFSVTG